MKYASKKDNPKLSPPPPFSSDTTKHTQRLTHEVDEQQ
jgi:hypothetical protein